ncbi:MAG: sulfite exporter TauE/SafE family protein [Synergistaceae bacterium]|nr:sulfite exporter TauE/SafE family protein [Synergistaceae bacterium]
MTYLYELLALEQWDMTPLSAGLFCLAAFIAGFAKTGLPGATIVAVPLMAMVVPPKTSVGVLLPIYMIADVISLCYWWRYAERRCCFPYLLFVGLGIGGGSFVVGAVSDKTFGVIIGSLILSLILLSLLTEALRGRKPADIPEAPPLSFSAFFGFTAGLVSTLANAAGPIVSLYMILSRCEKFQFLGTTAVCAFFMNWAKIPLFVSLDAINVNTLKLDAAAIPLVAAGAFAGYLLAKRIPQKAFKNVVFVLAIAASLNLIFR